MLVNLKFKKAAKCIKEILYKTFEDKQLQLHFFFGLIILCIGTLSSLFVPFLLKKGVDSFSNTHPNVISLILLSYGIMWIISQGSVYIRAYFTYKIEQRITFVFGIKALSHFFGLSHSYFHEQKSGEITNVIRRAQRDVPSIVLGIFFHAVPTILEFICVIALIVTLYPLQYGLFMGAILVAYFLYTFLSMKTVLSAREKANTIDKNTDGVVTDWLSNYETIKVFGQKENAIRVCENELKKRELAEVAFMSKFSLIRLGQVIILGIGLTIITFLVGKGVASHTLTIGDFVLFNGYILQFIIPISLLGQVTQDIKKAVVDMKGLIEILLTESSIQEAKQPVSLLDEPISIDINNMCFSYGNRPLFKNVSMRIHAGETILIVGQTGIGKSSLAKLLLRIYDVSKGEILFNKTNIKQLSFQSLYESIGWVPQESSLLSDTIEHNIRFVRPEATKVEIEEALYRAELTDFIKSLPRGLNTHVGDRGYKLSGGEKQRLALARLFLRKPKICIFDEATSFLDRNTELTIQANVERYLPNMTKIIITHRPFMINAAHRILTFSNLGITEKEVSNEFNIIWEHSK